jgi:hypothetical protein
MGIALTSLGVDANYYAEVDLFAYPLDKKGKLPTTL